MTGIEMSWLIAGLSIYIFMALAVFHTTTKFIFELEEEEGFKQPNLTLFVMFAITAFMSLCWPLIVIIGLFLRKKNEEL